MARVKRAGKDDWFKVGVHIVSPTKQKLQDAKEDADSKGYDIVWVHPASSLKVIRKGR